MKIRNVFLLVIQLFLILLTSVCVIFCTENVIAAEEQECTKKVSYARLDKGLDSIVCPEYGITIRDVITNSYTLERHTCLELQEILVAIVVQTADEKLYVVSTPLGRMNEHKCDINNRAVVSRMRDDIIENNGIIFLARVLNRSGTKLLPIIVLRLEEVSLCESVIEMLLNPVVTEALK